MTTLSLRTLKALLLGTLLLGATLVIAPTVFGVRETGADMDGGGSGGGGGGGGTTTTQCNDGIDNDSNGKSDYPADLGCTSALDVTEAGYTPPTQCADGTDNDGNGLSDYPNDPGCSSATDTTETGYTTQCNDGIDNDSNGKIDYPSDAGCSSVTDTSETGYTPPPTPPPGVIVYKTQSKRDYYVKVKPDQARFGIDETSAHGYPQYPSNVVSPTGTHICSLYDPTAFITEWSLGGFDSAGNNRMAAWNGTRWYTQSANSFGNKRYNYLTCKTNAPPDTSLTASRTSISSGESVTLTWASQYGQIRKGSFTAQNFSLSTTIPAHWETVSNFTCDPGGGDDNFNDSYNTVRNNNSSFTALAANGSCWWETSTEWVPESTTARPYGGSKVVAPTETTTYTYTGTNANGSNSSSVTVVVGPGTTYEFCDALAVDSQSPSAPNARIVTLYSGATASAPDCRASCDSHMATESEAMYCNLVVTTSGQSTCFLSDQNPAPISSTATVSYSAGSCTYGGTQCSDVRDNDGDGDTDLADPGCSDVTDTTEDPNPAQCVDRRDNDNDGLVDANDGGCESGNPNDNDESGDGFTCTPTPANVSVGGSATYSVPNGYGPYSWSPVGTAVCDASTSSSVTCTFPSTGQYQMDVTGSGGTPSDSCSLVTAGCTASDVEIHATPDRVNKGDTTTISWSASDTCSCTVSGPGLTSNDSTNSQDVLITDQSVFTIDCAGTKSSVIVNIGDVNVDEF